MFAPSKATAGRRRDVDAGERRKRAVVELHADARERAQRPAVISSMRSSTGLVGPEHGAARDAEQEGVADLAGGAGDGDLDGRFRAHVLPLTSGIVSLESSAITGCRPAGRGRAGAARGRCTRGSPGTGSRPARPSASPSTHLSTFAWPGVVRGQREPRRRRPCSRYFCAQVAQVPAAVADVDVGIGQVGLGVVRAAGAVGDALRRLRQQLHQARRRPRWSASRGRTSTPRR